MTTNLNLYFQNKTKKFSKGKYFGAIAADSPIGTSVLQVKAEDKDSGKYGKIEYRILSNDKGSEYFAMDSRIIKSKKLFDSDVGLPFRFTVEARDNPTSEQDSNTETVPVVINLITDRNRLILVIDDAKPETIQNEENNKIASVLEDHTNLIIGIEKVDSRQFLGNNSTIEIDKDGSDVWFYAVDPETETILERNSSRVLRSIMDADVKSGITRDIRSTIQATTSGIHGPLMVMNLQKGSAVSWDVFPYALIIIACIIFILGSAGIIYICISWSRYKAYKERLQRMYVVPRYDPVFVEPNLKEYETQVLQMSVPLDDSDSYNDLQLDFSSKNHAFSLDNVSYITKENGGSIGQQSPVSSDAATTARASSIAGGGHHRSDGDHDVLGHDSPHVTNPVYQRSDENSSHMNASATNENVTFREKKDYSHLGFTYLGDRSPVETTTEL